jgi:hypothetical protein
MQTTQQLADLQTAIKKTLHSSAFAKFMGQAVQTAFAEAEPASGAVVLPAQPLNRLRFSEGADYRHYSVRSASGDCEVRMQCERTPVDKRHIGTWYGCETRTDNEGREWTRSTGRMVQDDFGMLVQVAG